MKFSLPPSKVKDAVELCMKARLVPFIQGSPGIGKSQIVKSLADEYGLKLIDCRLSTMEPTDLVGLPWIEDGKAKFNPYSLFPLEDSPIPEGYEGFLLFLDEFNSANKAVQAAAYRVVLDREIGQHKLHPRCMVVAAGNLLEDNAITTQLSTAMMSRVVHLYIESNFEDWRDNFALPNRIDERVIAYLSMYPDKMMVFDPEREDETFPSPRTWEFVSKIIKANGGMVDDNLLPVLAGAISSEQAMGFVQFCKVSKNLITMDQIMSNPDIDPPKNDTAVLWATIIHLINRTDHENFPTLVKFIRKVPSSFQIVYLRSLRKIHRQIVNDPLFMEFVADLGDYCFGDAHE